jgi:hypothetical protein
VIGTDAELTQAAGGTTRARLSFVGEMAVGLRGALRVLAIDYEAVTHEYDAHGAASG